ncbi:MAG: YggS family pyridoxal phosphate-dependent enzyme [Bacteroidota bacterium]
MCEVVSNLLKIKDSLSKPCTVVAVSKTKPIEDIQQAYNSGHRDFAENKVQELTEKADLLPKDIRWHFIGHLQRNKVKYIVPFIHLIHGVDSPRLLNEINKRAKNENKIIQCLLQVHIAEEDTKFGFNKPELLDMIQQDNFKELENVLIMGLMGMATYTTDQHQIRREFRSLKNLFEELRELDNKFKMKTLSMGMSGDYQIALEEGSNMIRIGSAIFGERNH